MTGLMIKPFGSKRFVEFTNIGRRQSDSTLAGVVFGK